jgi:hypothetical protein
VLEKMWYEIIPSFAIITVAVAVPGVLKYFGHQLIFGNVRNNWILGTFTLLKV